MNYDLKPYSDYKKSKNPFLEKVPAHWDEPNLWILTKLRNEKNPGNLPLLSVFLHRGIILHNDANRQTHAPSFDLSNYQVVKKGDFVLNNQQAWRGSVGVSGFEGIISPAYLVLQLSIKINTRYADYLVQSSALVNQYVTSSKGVGDIQRQLYWPYIRYVKLCLPPLEEQNAIARYLDHMDQLIKRFIRAKQKQIKILNEQKKAIIQQAVTRGIDSYLEVKPSGIERLGDVPEQWNFTRVKNEFVCLDNKRKPLSSTQRGFMTSRQYDYYGASGKIDKVDDYLFDEDLLLLAEDGVNLVLRNLPLVIFASGKYWVNNHAHILKPKHGNVRFLAYVLEGINYRPWISGAAQPKLTQDHLMSISICVPQLIEQERIVDWIDTNTRSIVIEIEQTIKEMATIKEYHDCLISEVVTGKVDVRILSNQLPDDPANLEQGEDNFEYASDEIEDDESEGDE